MVIQITNKLTSVTDVANVKKIKAKIQNVPLFLALELYWSFWLA